MKRKIFHTNPLQFVSTVIMMLTVAACGGGSSGSTTNPPPALPVSSVYVMDEGAGLAVRAWDSAGTVNGNIAPNRSIAGANTGIVSAAGIEFDSRSNSVFVGDSVNAIRIYDNVLGTNGNVAASRTVTGAATQLNGGYDMALDKARDFLYVATGSGILAFANASTMNGNVAPTRIITGANVPVGGNDHRFALDATNDRLYISDYSSSTILVYDNISTVNGNVAPNRVITGVASPWGIAVDVSRNILFVNLYSSASIVVFDNASTMNGAVTPNRTLTGAAISMPEGCGLTVDEASNVLYATNGSGLGVLIWNAASTITGNIAPNRTISGASTGFARPVDIVGVN